MPVGSHVKSGRRATAGGGTGVREAADELFLMTDLFPATAGLPMVIWDRPELLNQWRLGRKQRRGLILRPCAALALRTLIPA
jgi:hypothetical protein